MYRTPPDLHVVLCSAGIGPRSYNRSTTPTTPRSNCNRYAVYFRVSGVAFERGVATSLLSPWAGWQLMTAAGGGSGASQSGGGHAPHRPPSRSHRLSVAEAEASRGRQLELAAVDYLNIVQ